MVKFLWKEMLGNLKWSLQEVFGGWEGYKYLEDTGDIWYIMLVIISGWLMK